MKPIKQTVYLPINDQWVEDEPTLMSSDGDFICNLYQNIGYFFTPEQLNEYTERVIKKALEVAADKACGAHCTDYIDKQSITNTFEETFKQFEV